MPSRITALCSAQINLMGGKSVSCKASLILFTENTALARRIGRYTQVLIRASEGFKDVNHSYTSRSPAHDNPESVTRRTKMVTDHNIRGT